MYKILIVTLFSLISFATLNTSVSAQVTQQTIDRELRLTSTGVVNVTETVSTNVASGYRIPAGSAITFRIFNPILNDQRAKQKIDQTLPTINVSLADGTPLEFSTQAEGQDIVITTRYPDQVIGTGPKIVITYDSYSLSSQVGAVYDLYVPSFSENFIFSDENTSLDINTTVIIPTSLGEINFASPDEEPVQENNNYIFEYSRDELTGVVAWIQIGTTQYYQFEIRQPFTASSNMDLFQNEYEVRVPRDIDAGPLAQRAYFSKITPSPTSSRLDDNGNLTLTFNPDANESGEFLIEGYVEVSDNKSDSFINSGTINDIPSELKQNNTEPGEFWEVNNPAIQQVAQELKGNKIDVYEITLDTYNYVVDLIDYSEVKRFGLNERQGALKTLQGGAAVCMEYSDLFITLMRAQGVPARAAFGYGYDARSTDGVDTAHQWAEVYIPSIDEWILVDTTWGETGANIIGGDLNHFYKYVATQNPQEPPPVSVKFFGELTEIKQEEFVINAVSSPKAGSYLSQSNVLANYPDHPQSNNLAGEYIAGAINLAGTINGDIDNFLANRLSITNEQHLQIARVLIYSLPITILFSVISMIRTLRSSPETANIDSSKNKQNVAVTFQGSPK